MEDQNYNLQSTSQPSEMADGEEFVSARESLCQLFGYCVRTGSDHCFCMALEQEKDATPQAEPMSIEAEEKPSVQDNSLVNEDLTEDTSAGEGPSIRYNRFVGMYRIETTSPLNLECGMYALEISTRAQLGQTLTEPDFRAVYATQQMEAFNRSQGHQGVVNQYHDDQLAFVLRMWAEYFNLGDIQLGVILEGEHVDYVVILGADNDYNVVFSEEDMENVRGLTTVWIHNDNAEERFGGMNHFSGVTLLDPDEEPANHSRPEPRAGAEFRAEEGRVTELDDGDDDERGQEKEPGHSVETAIDLDSDAPGGQETEDEESVQDSSTTLSDEGTIPEAENSPEEGNDGVEMGEGAGGAGT